MIDKKTPILNALEADLERETQSLENSAIRIGEILIEIKDSEAWKMKAGYASFQGYYKARQDKRIEGPLKMAEFWEKLNQGEEPVTRKRVSDGIRKEKAGGPLPSTASPTTWASGGGAARSGRRSRASGPSSSTAT